MVRADLLLQHRFTITRALFFIPFHWTTRLAGVEVIPDGLLPIPKRTQECKRSAKGVLAIEGFGRCLVGGYRRREVGIEKAK